MTSRVFVVPRSPLARPLTAVIAAVLVSGALAGCTGFSIDGGCTPAFQPGDASNAVTRLPASVAHATMTRPPASGPAARRISSWQAKGSSAT